MVDCFKQIAISTLFLSPLAFARKIVMREEAILFGESERNLDNIYGEVKKTKEGEGAYGFESLERPDDSRDEEVNYSNNNVQEEETDNSAMINTIIIIAIVIVALIVIGIIIFCVTKMIKKKKEM